jgi:hypothetical protein
MKTDPRYLNALETFKEFDRDALRIELSKRGITGEEWNNFVKE